MHHHFLKLNINKTDVKEISLYPSLMPKVFTHSSLFLDDNTHLNFDTVKQVKNLGFIFDDTLCLEPQINQVIKTATIDYTTCIELVVCWIKIENYGL